MRPLLQELAPRKESLTMENVFAPQASATSNGYISRTKHRRRGVQRLSNVLRSSPSFKTIPSSIGAKFADAASRNGQTNQPTKKPTNQPTNRLTEANFIGRRLKPGGFAAGQKYRLFHSMMTISKTNNEKVVASTGTGRKWYKSYRLHCLYADTQRPCVNANQMSRAGSER